MSALVLCGIAVTTAGVQLAVVGRLSMTWQRALTDVASAVIQGLVLAVFVRRKGRELRASS